MHTLILAILAAATMQTAAAPALDLDKSRPVRIIENNQGVCLGGRIAEHRAFAARMTANKLARDLRKQGYTVIREVRSAGMDRSQPDINVRIFTATC